MQKTTTELQQHLAELQHDNNNLTLEITQEEDFSSNDVLIPSSNMGINYPIQKPRLNEPLLEFHENSNNKDISLEVQQEDVISINDVLIPQPNVSINHNQNENETCHYPSKVEPSSRVLIFDTKDFF